MSAVATTIEVPSLTFSVGIPGFPDAHTFVLFQNDLARDPFSIMRCVEDENLEFVVVPPQIFFPEYAPVVDDSTVERIGLDSADDAILLTILTVGEDVGDMTANLLGPIVINRQNNQAAQAILVNQDYELRTPLFG